jgi:hypothetical protein
MVMENEPQRIVQVHEVEVKVTWKLVWGIWWRMFLIGLAFYAVIWGFLFIFGLTLWSCSI